MKGELGNYSRQCPLVQQDARTRTNKPELGLVLFELSCFHGKAIATYVLREAIATAIGLVLHSQSKTTYENLQISFLKDPAR